MNVLSLFDGMSCGQISLKELDIDVSNYFASEIDKYAIKVTQHNFQETKQLGSVVNWREWNLPKLDLFMGGSPCQDLSRAKNSKENLNGGKSKLFYDFYDALEYHSPKYFLLENVLMDNESEDIISSLLGVKPIFIDSGDFTAQNRPRLYWTNIDFNKDWLKSDLVLKDIMENEVENKYYYDLPLMNYDENKKIIGNLPTHKDNGKRRFTDLTSRVYNRNAKCGTLTAVSGGHQEKKVLDDLGVRKLTPLEYERLQGVPEYYTSCVSNSQRYKMLGNGWTIPVIKQILGGLK